MNKRRPLRGAWLRIAQWIMQGDDDVYLLRLRATDVRERSQMQGNVDKMYELGFLRRISNGNDEQHYIYWLSPLGLSLIPEDA